MYIIILHKIYQVPNTKISHERHNTFCRYHSNLKFTKMRSRKAKGVREVYIEGRGADRLTEKERQLFS